MSLQGAHRDHAVRIIQRLSRLTAEKYAAGQREHGGDLWKKGGLLRELEHEVVDQGVYALTLREQLATTLDWLMAGKVEEAMIALNLILHGTPEDRLPE